MPLELYFIQDRFQTSGKEVFGFGLSLVSVLALERVTQKSVKDVHIQNGLCRTDGRRPPLWCKFTKCNAKPCYTASLVHKARRPQSTGVWRHSCTRNLMGPHPLDCLLACSSFAPSLRPPRHVIVVCGSRPSEKRYRTC